jgi:transcriptional regulator with XRE-family HTH domain
VNNDQALRRIGLLIKEGRNKLGMSQVPFAEHAGVDAKTISSMERGKRVAWEQSQRKVEAALGWRPGSIQEVLDDAENIPITSLTLDSMLEGAGHATWFDLDSEEALRRNGPVTRASQLTDEELLAELSYRFRNYKNRLNGELETNQATPS